MLVPNIFASSGPKKLNKNKMKIIKEKPVNKCDNDITILNLSGSGHSDNNIHNSPNWSMFKHITIEEKDAKKLLIVLQQYFNKKQRLTGVAEQ